MKAIIYLIILLVLSVAVFADDYDYIIIDKFEVGSFVGLDPSSDQPYAGSSIKYNVIFHFNGSTLLTNRIQAQIINENGDVIDEKKETYNLTKGGNYSINSSVGNGLLRLIYADVPGVYKLKLNSESVMFFEEKESGFRQDYSIPLFFEVKSPEEKRMLDSIASLIESIKNLAKETEESNKQSFNLNQKLYIVTLAMLLISFVALFFNFQTLTRLANPWARRAVFVIDTLIMITIIYLLFRISSI